MVDISWCGAGCGAARTRRSPTPIESSSTAALMAARRAVGVALKRGDPAGLAPARAVVNEAKIALGERGPIWWTDGAPDLNRRMVRTTPYADWYRSSAVMAPRVLGRLDRRNIIAVGAFRAERQGP